MAVQFAVKAARGGARGVVALLVGNAASCRTFQSARFDLLDVIRRAGYSEVSSTESSQPSFLHCP